MATTGIPVGFLPSPLGSADDIPLAYTGTPTQLMIADAKLVLKFLPFARGILLPWRVLDQDKYDELYFSRANLFAITIHSVLITLQGFWLFSLPFMLLFPAWITLTWITGFLVFNNIVCQLCLNGWRTKLLSKTNITVDPKHASEYWIYMNGVSVG
ncbi:hypothetical protein LTS18_004666 [Coniosporium uncinatum]|uniref:Uncharacterized protein n=1 Tax=Coniosporium uncinatum TaxID=93489 RepID=A0ACC3D5H6_9PEZI|nr:hypothetical protein LTS18_004666 [Coniosporium uncinatum]